MNADGTGMTCVSMNTLSDLSPQVLPDGRVLFTRWEYVDRDLTYRQSLWTQNPDGSSYQLFFGNTIRDVGTFWQARPLPSGGSRKVVATFAPHHGYPQGAIGLIDRSYGVEGERGKSFVYITPEIDRVGDTSRQWAWRDPYPVDDDLFLCSYGSDGPTVLTTQDGASKDPRYRIWLLDTDGQRRMIYEAPRYSCFQPQLVQEQVRPPVVADRLDSTSSLISFRPTLTKEQTAAFVAPWKDRPAWGIPEHHNPLQGEAAGQVVLVNVYHGIEDFVPKGTIKSLRIMEQIRKTEDLVARAYDQSPVMSYGTYYAKRNWGTVPVESDGSAHFFVPALREIYFQALDAQGREVHRMTSAAQFMPGESTSCLGCHEPRDTTGTLTQTSHRPLAASRKPDIPKLPDWMTELPKTRTNQTLDAGIVDYPSVVQPVLDRYCLECHDGSNPDGGYNLSGDKTRFFSMSYDNLLGKSRSYRQFNMTTGELLPEQAALGKPLVQFHWLLFTPTAINMPGQSGTHASRLLDLFAAMVKGKKIKQEDFERVTLWIDSNVPYYGTYRHGKPKAAGRRDRWADSEHGLAPWMKDVVLPYWDKQCANCHGNLLGGNKDLPGVHVAKNIDWIGRFAWINLTRPADSPFLTVHLAKDAGGRGIPTVKGKSTSLIYTSRKDADYCRILQTLEQGRDNARTIPEADQRGFSGVVPEP